MTIPKGAGDGQTIRLRGQGMPGRGGEAGDALIELKVQPHPLYRREGADLHMDLPVSVPDAVLGGKVTVKTPDGAVSMTIPKASNSGQVLRLKGKGAFAGGKRGRSAGEAGCDPAGIPGPQPRQIRREMAGRPALFAGQGVMTPGVKPSVKPARPWFSAGPTAKRPGWSLAGLPTDLLGRGIRAPEVVERFAYALRLTREVLQVPEDYVTCLPAGVGHRGGGGGAVGHAGAAAGAGGRL